MACLETGNVVEPQPTSDESKEVRVLPTESASKSGSQIASNNQRNHQG